MRLEILSLIVISVLVTCIFDMLIVEIYYQIEIPTK